MVPVFTSHPPTIARSEPASRGAPDGNTREKLARPPVHSTQTRGGKHTASKGGNYLLNIGPKPDGTIPQSTIDTLHAIGGWMKVHGEAIYGTTASPFTKQLPWGRCTQKQIGNGVTRLYLHIFQWPFDSVLRVPALENEIVGASLLSQPGAGPLQFSRDKNGDALVQLPIAEPNDYCTVVVLDIKGNPRLHSASATGLESGLIPQLNDKSQNQK